MSKLEILFYVVIVAVLIILFSGCECKCSNKWKVTLPDGRSCVGTVHYYGHSGTDVHCDDGTIFMNVTNARMVRY